MADTVSFAGPYSDSPNGLPKVISARWWRRSPPPYCELMRLAGRGRVRLAGAGALTEDHVSPARTRMRMRWYRPRSSALDLLVHTQAL